MGDWFKELLTRVGARCRPGLIHRLNATLNYLEVGRWMRQVGADVSNRCRDREELYDWLAERIADQEVLYLEFGVFRGETMRYWSGQLQHPNSRLHGFDSFEGLPSAWNWNPRGTFSTAGKTPRIDDPRVSFFPGLFQDTLPGYVVEPGRLLLVNMDADLYTSTLFVLRTLQDALVPGSYLLFDEFSDRNHEMRAFSEFVEETSMKFELLRADRTLAHVLFRRVDDRGA